MIPNQHCQNITKDVYFWQATQSQRNKDVFAPDDVVHNSKADFYKCYCMAHS